jgi:hypothetical protein
MSSLATAWLVAVVGPVAKTRGGDFLCFNAGSGKIVMTKEADEKALDDKLEDIRNRLMGDPSDDELRSMQLQMDALQRWAQLSRVAADPEHVDHMDDHDHTMPTEIGIIVERSELA